MGETELDGITRFVDVDVHVPKQDAQGPAEQEFVHFRIHARLFNDEAAHLHVEKHHPLEAGSGVGITFAGLLGELFHLERGAFDVVFRDELQERVLLGKEVSAFESALVVNLGQWLRIATKKQFTLHGSRFIHPTGAAFGAVEMTRPTPVTSLDLEDFLLKRKDALGDLIVGAFARPKGHDGRERDRPVFDKGDIFIM